MQKIEIAVFAALTISVALTASYSWSQTRPGTGRQARSIQSGGWQPIPSGSRQSTAAGAVPE